MKLKLLILHHMHNSPGPRSIRKKLLFFHLFVLVTILSFNENDRISFSTLRYVLCKKYIFKKQRIKKVHRKIQWTTKKFYIKLNSHLSLRQRKTPKKTNFKTLNNSLKFVASVINNLYFPATNFKNDILKLILI